MNDIKFLSEYKKLNPKQKKAVDTIEGPVMVIAGPGTGKTQILAMRIANILNKTQVNPSNILCLTFTNSAAHEMRTRLLNIIGNASYAVHVHTFHSFCNEVINTYPEKFVTSKSLNQLSDLDQINIIRKIIDKNNFNYLKPFKSPYYFQRAIISTLSTLKQEGITPGDFINLTNKEELDFENIKDLTYDKGVNRGKLKAKYETLKSQINRNLELSKVYSQYQKALELEGRYDFADMILSVVNIFNTDSEILLHYQEKYQYILVDEYQDTNTAQNKVVHILGSFHDEPNIFVVGDDEQSIFRFQGASLENILTFKNIYPKTITIVLDYNYRSTQTILDASRALIKNNGDSLNKSLGLNKNLKSLLKTSNKLDLAVFSNDSVENYFIANKISNLIHHGVNPNKIAVIYREHKDANDLVDLLSKLNVPYILEASFNCLDDPEIQKLIIYLKSLSTIYANENNELLLEAMHYPFFNIEVLDIYKIAHFANKHRLNIIDILSSPKTFQDLNLKNQKNVNSFLKLYQKNISTSHNVAFAHAFEELINSIGYLEYLLKLPQSIHHLNRLQSLFEEIKLLNIKNNKFKLEDFLKHIELLDENNLLIKERELSANYEGVRLMTAHKAKGQEFEYVFIMHLTDNRWGKKTFRELIKLPSILSQKKLNEDLAKEEEERRLFYVALTRAKHHISLTYSNTCIDNDTESETMPSRYLSEIPAKYIENIDVTKLEQKYAERLQLSLQKKKWNPSGEVKNFLKTIVSDFKLSPTGLNAYLECPKRFFYDNILRVPKTKDFNQSYGTAVHSALEQLFRIFKRDFKLPSKNKFLKFFQEALDEEIFTSVELERAKDNGLRILSAYYDYYSPEWKNGGIPLSCEYNFSYHNVYFNKIPIAGRVDRIDLINKIGNLVKIIDYKTTTPKSQNFLLGLTKEKNTNYLYQAYFYQLLSECDPAFSWQVRDIIFDFVSPEKGKFRTVQLPVEADDYQDFKTTLEKVYNNIVSLDFQCDRRSCNKNSFKCPYLNICQISS